MHALRRSGRAVVGLTVGLSLVLNPLAVPSRVLASNPNLQHFGFALVDTAIDDPYDGVAKTNYIDEVGSFTNLNHLWVWDPAVSIASRLDLFAANGSLAIVDVKDIFLTCSAYEGGTGSGTECHLRANYRGRWNQFLAKSRISAHLDQIGAFYIADEPAWTNTSAADLATIANRVNASFPAKPITYVEAYTVLEDPSLHSYVSIPENVDWVGFDRYGTIDPQTDPAYQADLAVLKSKRTANQKIIVVFESHYLDPYYVPYVTQEDMAQIFLNYYGQATTDTDTVAMLGWHWPGGVDAPPDNTDLGARELPATVLATYVQVGQAISGTP